jgi:hypothetical protein
MIQNTQNFRTYWQNKGSEFGKCHTLQNSPWFWINIPKNASSFTQTLFAHQLLWTPHNYFDIDVRDKTAIVVLRDPVERWISGISEYVSLYHKNFNLNDLNNQMLDWIFDRVAFDDHTEAQIYFIQDLDLSKTIWFRCDMDFENKLIKWMESVGLVQSGFQVPDCVREFDNISSSDHDKKNIKTYFRQVIESNPGYLRSLKKYFDEDYNLINQINFK